jgi:hypothetical protein
MSAEGKILAAEFTTAVLLIGGYIIYSGSRDGIQPSVANLPDRDDGRPALAEGNYSGATSQQTEDNNDDTTRTKPNTIGSTYRIVPHPEHKSATCVQLDKTTSQNPQTVFGAAESINDPKIYIDTNTFDVYTLNTNDTHTKIGSFASSSMPGSQYNLVPVGTTVCDGVE